MLNIILYHLGVRLLPQSFFNLQLNIKIEKSAKELAKLNFSWQPAELDVDPEIITEEERECLRKIGLKHNSCLVLGEGKTPFLVAN